MNSIGYITVTEIAQELTLGEKTVRRHLPDVAGYFCTYGLVLKRVRGMGVLLEGTAKSRMLAYSYLQSAERLSRFNAQERQLYLLGKLLLEDRGLSVSQAARHLYVSRPSIYKSLEELRSWLGQREIELVRIQGKGVQLRCGEKRLRSATVDWHILLRNYLRDGNDEEHILSDLKQMYCVNDSKIARETVNSIVSEVEKAFTVSFQPEDFRRLCIFTYFSLPRVRSGHCVSISNQAMSRIDAFDSVRGKEIIADIVLKFTGIALPDTERHYFFAIFGQASTHRNVDLGAWDASPAKEPIRCFCREIYRHFAIRDKKSYEENIERCITNIIKRHAFGAKLIPAERSVPPRQFSFVADVVHAALISKFVQCQYMVNLQPNDVSEVVFQTTAAIENSKRPLRAVLVFDRSYSEAMYVTQVLSNNIAYIRINQVTPAEPLKTAYSFEKADIILTNLRQEIQCGLPIVNLNFELLSENLEQVSAILQQYYRRINDALIFKKKAPAPSEEMAIATEKGDSYGVD